MKKKNKTFDKSLSNVFASQLVSGITGFTTGSTIMRADEQYKYTTHITGRYSKIDAEFDELWMMKTFMTHIIENADLEDFRIINKKEKKLDDK